MRSLRAEAFPAIPDDEVARVAGGNWFRLFRASFGPQT